MSANLNKNNEICAGLGVQKRYLKYDNYSI